MAPVDKQAANAGSRVVEHVADELGEVHANAGKAQDAHCPMVDDAKRLLARHPPGGKRADNDQQAGQQENARGSSTRAAPVDGYGSCAHCMPK